MKLTHHDRRISRPVAAEARGFGLVELMISIVIGLVIIAALVTLFVNTSRNNREMATANSVIENGRFAIDLLENEVVHAGYWSTYVPDFDDPTLAPSVVPTSTPVAVPDPCAAFDAATWIEGSAFVNGLIGIPVQVIPDGSAVCNAVIKNRVAGTDAIVIRHAGRCVPDKVTCPPEDDPAVLDLFIQASLCVDELDDGNLYVFGRNTEETFPLHRRNCTTPAEKRRFESYIFYVRDYAVKPGDGIPTLVRSDFRLEGGTLEFRAPVPMVEGVDGLWAELGIDDVSITGAAVDNSAALVWEDPGTKMRATNRGDSVPDEFVRCTVGIPCTAGQLTNVTAVQMYVLARSREATRGYTDTKAYSIGAAGNVPAFNDGFKRHVYSTTVRLHNIAGRRIRPGDEEAP